MTAHCTHTPRPDNQNIEYTSKCFVLASEAKENNTASERHSNINVQKQKKKQNGNTQHRRINIKKNQSFGVKSEFVVVVIG